MAFTKNEDIKNLDDAGLDEYINSALDAFNELAKVDDSDLTDEQIEDMRSIHEEFDAAKNLKSERKVAAEQRANELAQLRDSMKVEDEEEPEAEAEADAEADAEAEDSTDEVEETPAPDAEEAPAAPEDEEEEATKASAQVAEVVQINSEAEPAEEGESLVASANESVASRAAKKAPAAERGNVVPRMSLTAAANVPNMVGGTKFSSIAESTEVIKNSLKAFPSSPQPNTRVRQNALVLKADGGEFTQGGGKYATDDELIDAVRREARLSGNSLVAAGGWGSPSEQVLEFCEEESTDGLIDLPEITVTRGGINYTKGPDFEDILNSATGFWDMTEATAEAGTEEKTSLRPQNPTFDEVRLDAVGVMIEAGLLMKSSFPELIQRYERAALVAHQMKISAKVINAIKGYTGAAKDLTGGFGNALDLLHALDLVIASERQRLALADSATLEVALPSWAKNVIKADLAQRNGVDFLAVTDAQINGWFAARNARPQYLRYLQPLTIDDTAGIALGYPSTVNVLVYQAGTYVKGVQDVITLDTVYDSTNLKKNDYVHLFAEQGLAVLNPCGKGHNLNIPFTATGLTAANNTTAPLAFANDTAV